MIDSKTRTIQFVWMCLCVAAATAFSQASSGTITGVVTDQEGGAFGGAFVQLKNTRTAAASNAVSAAGGKYTFAQVAPGTYELSVMVPGMKAYQQTGIAVQPAPRTSDGKPDLTGMWLGGPAQLPELHMLPWAEALAKARKDNNLKDLPISHCLPAGPVPLLGPDFFKLVQTPTLLVMMFEDDTPRYRQVFLDGRSHPKDFGPTWLGHTSATRTIRTCRTWSGSESHRRL
jgi:hypothetical protein